MTYWFFWAWCNGQLWFQLRFLWVVMCNLMDVWTISVFNHSLIFSMQGANLISFFSQKFLAIKMFTLSFLASLLPGSLTLEINIYWWFEWRKQVLTYSQQIERSNWVAFIIFWQFNSRKILVKIFQKQSQEYKLCSYLRILIQIDSMTFAW